ncbi:MAG TPA: glutamyl-tRNA reductase [Acidimicrobiales bacterium]|jgi:glutamyl-tRNA reductase|nr:glutamyl-tRNA reductase [Acidimicrobiales bacterium]
MAVISVGVDHEHAPLALLEAVTVPAAEWHKVLVSLASLEDVAEVVLVSTCLRTEVYAVIERFHGAVDGITAILAERAGVDATELTESTALHFDRGVPAHLFAVAAGLRSAVPGETEVLGQLRRSLEHAEAERVVGPELTELFRRALATGRRARAETAIARGTTSFAHATVAMAAARLGSLESRSVVVVGAGQLATGLVEALAEGRRGAPSRVVVANRTLASARALAARDPERIAAVDLDALPTSLVGADLVITAVQADRPVVTAAMLAGVGHDVLVVDLSMPRTVAHEATSVPGVTLLDLAHLRDVVNAALRERHDEISAAEAIVEEEVGRHLESRRVRGAAPLVTELRARLEALRAAELARLGSELDALSDEQRAVVEQLTKALVAKIAHDPTVALRESAGTDRGQRLADSARALFDL